MRKRNILTSGLVAGLALVALTGCAPTYDGTATGCTVEEKDSQAVATMADRPPRVYTTCGVFHIEDDIAAGQFNAADTYMTVEVGKTYDFEAVGYRNGFFSLFPNIISAQEVTK